MKTLSENVPNPWRDYWETDDFWASNELWLKNSEIFMEKITKIFSFSPNHVVLDIGCGMGYLENFLAPKVREVWALDTSEKFLERTEALTKPWGNVRIQKLEEDYTHLQGVPSFDLCLCVSVVQYYRNLKEVETLIQSAQKIASPGAQMLLADLPQKRSSLGKIWNLIHSFSLALKGGYGGLFLKTVFRYLRPNRYAHFCEKYPSLFFSRKELEDLVSRSGLRAKIFEENVSLWAKRLNLLIYFD